MLPIMHGLGSMTLERPSAKVTKEILEYIDIGIVTFKNSGVCEKVHVERP